MRGLRPIYILLAVLTLGLVGDLALTVGVFMRSVNTISNTQLHSCEIANITRALDNASHYDDYKYYTQQITFTKTSLQSDYAALAKVGIDKKVLNRALAQSKAGLTSEENDADGKTWATLTDCDAPNGNLGVEVYTFASVPPPANQLSPLNATKPDPAGSVN